MAVAVSNSVQWFWPQLPRSLPIRTVMPAEAQAAANVRVEVTCRRNVYGKLSLKIKGNIFAYCYYTLSTQLTRA